MFNVICIVHTMSSIIWNYGEDNAYSYQNYMSSKSKQSMRLRPYYTTYQIYTASMVLL
jgi:hypothetical protein